MAAISRLQQFKELHDNAFVFQRGIERETLRVTPNGKISQASHPEGLGSALTHSAITTDYSEALLEFITGVHTERKALLQELDELHRFSFSQLDNELFWVGSMPCVLPEQEQIPIAQYGDSHIGRLKTIYRHGLWHRYGRKMQTIAGLHYNWSLTPEFWRQWALVNGKSGDLTPFMTDEYFGLIRNFRRHSWLLLYLFGSSPAADASFLDEPVKDLESFDSHTLFAPYATSLRMSDVGYSNRAQSELFVCFNSLESYGQTLAEAIEMPYPDYEKIGLKNGDQYNQLNTSILQIENEYYSDIRPKRVVFSGEKALHALRTRGVEYIEVRCLDVNPYMPMGIDITQINFVDLFLLWCLVQDSPQISSDECAQLQENSQQVAFAGRDPSLSIVHKGEQRNVLELAGEMMDSITQFAQIIDSRRHTNCYTDTCAAQREKISDVSKTPSAKVLADIKKAGSYRSFILDQAQHHKTQFLNPLTDSQMSRWQDKATDSRRRQVDIEMSDQGPFDDFLEEYLRQ